jgi:trk system potassium uptake protein TrkH
MPIPPTTTALLILTGGFAGLIAIGTILLFLPISQMPDQQVSFRVALFTATSATCVTGLALVDTDVVWTAFGQGVIAALIFLGGLGVMTSGALLLLAVGRRLTLANRLVLQEPLGATSLSTVTTLGTRVFFFAVALQIAGTLFLFPRFLSIFPAGQAAWQALFHSISAFNNAGFSIMPNAGSLEQFQHDYWVLLIISLLIVVGGLSFIVISDMAKGRRFNRLRLDTQMVVISSIALWLLGSVVMFLFEFRNPATLGELPLPDQVANAAFQSISARTAGFNTVDFGLTRSATDFFYIFLMFIGGASASTAGGIKVNTAMVVQMCA